MSIKPFPPPPDKVPPFHVPPFTDKLTGQGLPEQSNTLPLPPAEIVSTDVVVPPENPADVAADAVLETIKKQHEARDRGRERKN